MPQIKVTFDIKSSGRVDVFAQDIGTGRRQKFTINSFRVSKEEVDSLIHDTQSVANEDIQSHEEIEAVNHSSKIMIKDIFKDLFGLG